MVSDLRWSTAISAPVFGVPRANLINAYCAYWSRRTTREWFPMPDHPILRLLSASIAEKLFPIALPVMLRHYAAPVNKLRREHGLPALGDLFDLINWGDRALFPE